MPEVERSAPAPRRKRRSFDEIQGRLLDAAKAEFSERGFSDATTAAIARRADVTEAQLFRYFATKSDLFAEAIFKPLNTHFEQFQATYLVDSMATGAVRPQANEYINELRAFIGDHAKMFMSLVVARAYAPDGTPGIAELESLRAYFDRGAAVMQNRLGSTPPVEPQLMVRVSFAAVLACELFKGWIFPPDIGGDEAIDAAIRDFVIDGLGANQDPGLKRT